MKVEIKISRCLLLLALIPLFEIQGLYYWMPLVFKIVFRVIMVADVLIILALYLILINKKIIKINPFVLAFTLFFFYNIFITSCTSGNVKSAMLCFLPSLGGVLLLDIFSDRINDFLIVLWRYLFTLVFLNQILIFLFPNGMFKSISIEGYSQNWLLGYKSSIQYFVLPLFVLSMINNWREMKMQNMLAIVLCNIQAITSSNKMLVIGIVIADVLYLGIKNGGIKKLLNIINVQIAALILNIVFLANVYERIPLIKYIVEDLLHKNLKGARGRLWSVTITSIFRNPIWGYGKVDDELRYAMYRIVNHAHNMLLEVLFQGGIIWLAIFFAFNCLVAIPLWKARNKEKSRIMCISLFVLYTMSIVEIYLFPVATGYWLIYALCTKIEENG